MNKIKYLPNGQWNLCKSDDHQEDDEIHTHIRSNLPEHISSMSVGHEPGTPGWKKYVEAAHNWHNEVHNALMADNPHMEHSYGEDLDPRQTGYRGYPRSTKNLDALHSKHKTSYNISH